MTQQAQIEAFLNGSPFAVAGASRDREKYGNKVLRAYMQNNLEVFPVTPSAPDVEGQTAYANLSSLPTRPHGVSIVTPGKVTEQIVADAIRLGIRHLWMQPGAETAAAVRLAEEAGINVIHGGPCLLVILRYHE